MTSEVSLLFTVKTMPLFMKGGLFTFAQGSPGTGTYRGKIHGISVLEKFLLPLLMHGFLGLAKRFLGLVPSATKDILPSLVLLMLSYDSLNPVIEVSKSICFFELDHGSLESYRKSLEESVTNHFFINVVVSHTDEVFEAQNIFV